MFKPMFALHKSAAGEVLNAGSFKHEYDLSPWLLGLDLRGGDVIEFGETVERPEFDEVPEAPPASIEAPTTPAPNVGADEEPTF